MYNPDWMEKIQDDYDENPAWFKTIYIRLIINHLDDFFHWYYWHITQKIVNIQNAKMRVTHGYDWGDVWNMNTWFVEGAVPILEHWIENGISFPGGWTDEGDKLSVESPEEWTAILTEMLEGFKLYKQCYVDGGIPTPKSEWHTTKFHPMIGDVTFKHRYHLTEDEDKKLKRSLYLFSKYFYTLWD